MEKLDARDPEKRWERAAYLRDVEDQEPKELLYLGFSAYDLMRAGFDETELRGAGFADAEILKARGTLKAETLKRMKRGSTDKPSALASGSRAESKVTPSA